MKKRINLLKTSKKLSVIEHFINRLKVFLLVLFIVFLIVYSFFYYLLIQQNRLIEERLSEKKVYLDYFIENKDIEAKFIYLSNKQQQLAKILKEDVNFYPYYNLLQESVLSTNIDAYLDEVIIDKSKTTSFSIIFLNYQNLLEFLKFAESNDFLENFSQLSLVNFSRNDLVASKSEFRLNFSGTFIDLNEN